MHFSLSAALVAVLAADAVVASSWFGKAGKFSIPTSHTQLSYLCVLPFIRFGRYRFRHLRLKQINMY
jgi:hypothetical protein